MRDYGKVHSSFWSSPTTGTLSDDGKVLALYLMTCSHSTIAGVFRLPDGYVSEDLGWTSARVSKGFAELFHKGFSNRCETTKWVWIRKHLDWNPPENPNQRKSAAKIAGMIPGECAWKSDFMRVRGEYLGIEIEPESNPSGTVAEPFLNQEQVQEQKQEQNKPLPLAGQGKAKGAKGEDLGNYPEELRQAVSQWRALLSWMKTPEIADQFPADKRFVASGTGTLEATWKAWEKRIQARVQGIPVTHGDMLTAIQAWESSKRRKAEQGVQLSGPMLPTLINSADFVDALVLSVKKRTAEQEVESAS